MAITAKLEAEARWVRELHSAETLADDLGLIGAWVGPRKGPDKRTHGQKEDYTLRRLLVAWKETDRLRFPVEVWAEKDRDREPDFVFSWPDGETLGVEVTEAGEENYQAWLTHIQGYPARGAVAYRADGYVGDKPERMAAENILDAIRSKVADYDKGKYRAPGGCDLLVYDNSETGWMADEQQVLSFIGRPDDLLGRFRQIHLVFGETVFLDLFGNDYREVDVRHTYEIDYARWIFDQVKRLRRGATDRLDLANIAEELESLGRSERRELRSHLRNLMLHLLKWQFQPDRRGQSWALSIRNARDELHEKLTEMPSLRPDFAKEMPEQYGRARKWAADETKLPLETFPEDCPYTREQLVDPEYLPDEQGQSSGG